MTKPKKRGVCGHDMPKQDCHSVCLSCRTCSQSKPCEVCSSWSDENWRKLGKQSDKQRSSKPSASVTTPASVRSSTLTVSSSVTAEPKSGKLSSSSVVLNRPFQDELGSSASGMRSSLGEGSTTVDTIQLSPPSNVPRVAVTSPSPLGEGLSVLDESSQHCDSNRHKATSISESNAGPTRSVGREISCTDVTGPGVATTHVPPRFPVSGSPANRTDCIEGTQTGLHTNLGNFSRVDQSMNRPQIANSSDVSSRPTLSAGQRIQRGLDDSTLYRGARVYPPQTRAEFRNPQFMPMPTGGVFSDPQQFSGDFGLPPETPWGVFNPQVGWPQQYWQYPWPSLPAYYRNEGSRPTTRRTQHDFMSPTRDSPSRSRRRFRTQRSRDSSPSNQRSPVPRGRSFRSRSKSSSSSKSSESKRSRSCSSERFDRYSSERSPRREPSRQEVSPVRSKRRARRDIDEMSLKAPSCLLWGK